MGWKVSCVMDEKMKFVAAALKEETSFAKLCRQFEISRKTGYKWLERYGQEGAAGLHERSRAPHTHPNAVSDALVERVLEHKRAHMGLGPKKIYARLQKLDPDCPWPAVSTIGEILDEHGLVEKRRRRNRATPSAEPLAHATDSNVLWCTDFKGWFYTLNGDKCTPLTICDAHSRFFLRCQAMGAQTGFAKVQPLFELTFREFGLPERIRSDNGPPFATVALAGLSELAIWWMRLGIVVERIHPGKPQENGRLERLHRTLKKNTASPPEDNLRKQQKAFDAFLHYYNNERPHEALGQETPASVYTPSLRPFPARLPPLPDYPEEWQVRKVRASGRMKFLGEDPFVSQALYGQYIGLEQIDDDHWKLWFMNTPLGVLDTRQGKIKRLKKEK